jgi:hypothetical protein
LESNKTIPSVAGVQAIQGIAACIKMHKTVVEITFHNVYKAPVVQIMR